MATELLDVSAILRPGVFLLWKAGHCVYVGKAKCLLAGIALHKTINRANLPSWIPVHRITFDHVEIIPCDTHTAITVQKALITLHNPRYNRTRPEADTPLPFVPPAPATTDNRPRRL